MKRDMIKTAAAAEDKPTAYDLTAWDLHQLAEIAKNREGLFSALCLAFNYGFVLGHRAARNGAIKRKL